jgi:tetratricopeptide (TPR) repeat protein
MLGYDHPMLLEPEMNPTPRTPEQLLQSVWQSLSEKDIRQAIASSNELNRTFPDFAPGWHAASHLAQLIKQPGPALIAINRALKLDPGNTDWQLHRTSCLLVSGENQTAKEAVLALLPTSRRTKPLTSKQQSQLAFLCNRLEMHKEAGDIYQSLIGLEPGNGSHWYNLATIQRFQGQLEEAEDSLDNAIELDPSDFEAYELRSDLRRQTLADNHVPELQKLLDRGIKIPAGEVRVCYALAKELEDIGDPQGSFESLKRGATLRRQHLNYRIDDDLQTISEIQATFNKDLINRKESGYSNPEPIFIIGLPRTGSTLIEKVLSSHPDVYAAGELNNLAMQMVPLAQKQAGKANLSRSELVMTSARLNFEELGKAYVRSTRPQTGHSKYFTDKMPLNFLYAGLIHLALPRAKIIHVSRHPMDTCYAIYKRLFQDAYPWSYDLGEIAQYFSAYQKLMSHWNSVLPGLICQVSYEDFVHDTETQARKLIDFCGLEWDPQCIHFHENKSTSTTASASQVRQPIYRSSVNRWKQYEQQLSALKESLHKLGVATD